MVWRVRSPLVRLRNISASSVIIFSLFSLIIYNEFLDYFFHSLWWSKLPNTGPREANVRILFVADPQLIGLHNENKYVGPFSRWDNDRYLSRTFHMAYSAVDPDVVVFMGDLLDEGSTSHGDEYAYYHQRFMNIFKVHNSTKRVYLAGDNDVGGEAFDQHEPWKVAQFEKYFNSETGISSVKFVDFIHMNFQFGNTYDRITQTMVESLRAQSHGKVRLLLNHMGIIQRHYHEYDKMLLTLAPSVVFTAHSHMSYVISCADCQQREPDPEGRRSAIHAAYDSSVYTFPIVDPTGFSEVVVPTCSYRMGVENMGYGAASLASEGSIYYTVLWVPSRYKQLFLYIGVPAGILVFLILRFIITTCVTYRREFCNISEEELHKKHMDLPNFSGCLGYAMRAIHFSLFCWKRLRSGRHR